MAQQSKSELPDGDLFEGTTMTFGEHLEELRVALFRALAGLVIGFLLGLLMAKHVVQWIQVPLKDALNEHFEVLAEKRYQALYAGGLPDDVKSFMVREGLVFDELYIERAELKRLATLAEQGVDLADTDQTLDDTEAPVSSGQFLRTRVWRKVDSDVRALSAQEPFMIWLKAAFVSGLLIASPYIFWQIWSFVAAGLYPHEKRYVYLFLPMSLILFWSGAALAFFFAFKYVLGFLFSFHRELGIQAEPRISEWIGFVLFLPLGFGVAFQLPMVMLFLNRIGIFSVQSYLEKWRIAILVIAVISMLLTPADPISMLLMAAPLALLYFLGIAMSQWLPRGRNPFDEVYEP